MSFIQVTSEAHVAVLTIDRPQGPQCAEQPGPLRAGSRHRCAGPEPGPGLIITGSGEKSFNGWRRHRRDEHPVQGGGEAFGKKGNDVFRKIETLPIPVIAAVNGFALGGGNELTMSCDIRICSDNAVFGRPETGLGITRALAAPASGPAGLPRHGQAAAVHCQNIKADEALRIGLVNAVYPQAGG